MTSHSPEGVEVGHRGLALDVAVLVRGVGDGPGCDAALGQLDLDVHGRAGRVGGGHRGDVSLTTVTLEAFLNVPAGCRSCRWAKC